MASDAGKAMFPHLAKKEVSSATRQQGQIPNWNFNAAEAEYPSTRVEPEPWFKRFRGKVPMTEESLSRVRVCVRCVSKRQTEEYMR
jgi:hypothetical protein